MEYEKVNIKVIERNLLVDGYIAIWVGKLIILIFGYVETLYKILINGQYEL